MKSVFSALLIALVAAAFAANVFLGDLAEDDDMRAERLFNERVEGYSAGVAAGNAAAQIALGQIYMDADAAYADPALAVSLFRQAAAQGVPEAHYRLGLALEEGRGVAADYSAAARSYQTTLRLTDHPQAMLALGMMHLEGRGVVHSEARAATFFRQAAALGYSPAQYLLGRVYESGFGVPKDPIEAYKWYLLSSRDVTTVKAFRSRFDPNAALLKLAKTLNRSQIESATKQAAEWKSKN